MFDALKQDFARIATSGIKSALRLYFMSRGECFPCVVWLRILAGVRANRILKLLVGPLIYLVYRHFEFKFQVYGNANIPIGIKDGKLPVVGDNVMIYPGAIVVGGIQVGEGAVIGALSYVAHDVPPGMVVAGAPVRIIGAVSCRR